MAVELSTLNGSNGFSILGEAAGDKSGFSVSGAGDFNGDGISDLLISAYLADPNGTSSGATYVIFGKSTAFSAAVELTALNGTNGFKISGEAGGDRSGYAVANAGDVNGDGISDIVIGAVGTDQPSTGGGSAYVVFGSSAGFSASVQLSSLNGSNGFSILGAAGFDHLGVSVSAAGDVNGDGVGDLIVGAKEANGVGVDSGASYVVFGSTSGFSATIAASSLNGTNGFAIRGAAAGDYSGASVSSAGDVNGDGVDDLLIGATSASGTGSAYVVFGKTSAFAAAIDLSALNGANGFRLAGVNPGDIAGYSVAAAGDVNGDGLDDVIVSALGAAPGGASAAGSSYVVFGRMAGFGPTLALSTLNGTNGFVINGADVGDESGISVSAAGDVNGDGIDDLLVGAFFADASGPADAGETYLIFGKSGGFASAVNAGALPESSGIVINGAAAGDLSGLSVAAAGDVNNDGIDDIIIGAAGADPGGRGDAGAAFVVFGSTSLGTYGATSGDDSIDGSPWDDFIRGFAGNDAVNGLAGADTLRGGIGADTLNGGSGIDTIDYSDATAKVTVRLWNQTATGDIATGDSISGFENVIGGSAGDAIVGSDAVANFIAGGGGADALVGLSGNDTLRGGAGADNLDGGAGVDTIDYSDAASKVTVRLWNQTATDGIASGDLIAGFENVFGGLSGDAIVGSDAVGNFIAGGAGADTIFGLTGNDTIRGGSGADNLNGGADADTLDYADAATKLTIRLWNQTATGDIATGDTVAGFEHVRGGSAGDAIVGSDIVANFLVGNGGNDTLFGLSGDDSLRGGAGADRIDGGVGVDTADYSDATAKLTIRLWNQTATGSTATGDTLANIENVFGGSGSDAIVGADNVANYLSGASGNDGIAGLSGDDTLVGGGGADTLTGGAGNDRFDFTAGAGTDRIADFAAGAGAGDVIRLVGLGPAFDSFAEVLAASTQSGANVIIDLGAGQTITLIGVAVGSLAADDFTFS